MYEDKYARTCGLFSARRSHISPLPDLALSSFPLFFSFAGHFGRAPPLRIVSFKAQIAPQLCLSFAPIVIEGYSFVCNFFFFFNLVKANKSVKFATGRIPFNV